MLTNCSEQPHARVRDERTTEQLLDSVRLRFYAGRPDPHQFHRDRRMLLYALTWPAVWLEQRGLFCSPHRYRTLISDRLDAIRAHGDPVCYSAYFPAYLLKCLQDFFDRHGDDLYGELKHIRNALESLQASLTFVQRATHHSRQIELLASAHRLICAQRGRHLGRASADQMDLF